MSTEALTPILVTAFITVVIGVFSWLLKDYLKGWKGETKEIRLGLAESNNGMKILLEGFHQFEKEIIKIKASLTAIEKEQSEASASVKETKELAFKNRDSIKEQEHDIKNIKNNYTQYSKLILENADRIKKIEDDLLVFKVESKA